MPVPMPSDAETLLLPPDAAETRTIAGGVAAAVSPASGLTSLQRLLLASITESMTGFVVPANKVPRLGPREFATALAQRERGFRERMVQFMLLCSLVLKPLPDEVVARVEEYARELGVDDPMIRVAEKYARGYLGLALVDFQRSGYMEAWNPVQSAALHTSSELSDAWQACVSDEALAQRWEALRDLPDGTLRPRGREILRRPRFRLPRPSRQRAAAVGPTRLATCPCRLRIDRRV